MIDDQNAMESITTHPKTTHVFGPPTRLLNAPIWTWMKNQHDASQTSMASTPTPWQSNNRQQAIHYAQMCCAFMQDLIDQGQLQPGEGIDIIDLGAGYGTLSALLVATLAESKAALGLSLHPTTHILIDANPACLKHWHNMPAFQSRPGSLDAIIADTAHLQHARLHHAHITLAERLRQRPALVIAHHLLCHLPFDLFHKDATGAHHVMHAQFSTPKNNLLHAYQPKTQHRVHASYEPVALTKPLYANEDIQTLLDQTLAQMPTNTYINFPITALQLLDFFKQHATRGLCLSLQDRPAQQLHHPTPQIYELQDDMVSAAVPLTTLMTYLKTWPTAYQLGCDDTPEDAAQDTNSQHPQVTRHWATLRAILWPHGGNAHHHTPTAGTPQTHIQPYCQSQPDDSTHTLHAKSLAPPYGPNLPASVTEVIVPMGYDPLLIAQALQDHCHSLPAHRQLTQSLLKHLLRHAHAYPEHNQLIEQAARAYQQLNMPQAALACYRQLSTPQRNHIKNLQLAIWCLTHASMRVQENAPVQQASDTHPSLPDATTLHHQLRKQQWAQGYQSAKRQLQKIAFFSKRGLWLIVFLSSSIFFLIK